MKPRSSYSVLDPRGFLDVAWRFYSVRSVELKMILQIALCALFHLGFIRTRGYYEMAGSRCVFYRSPKSTVELLSRVY